MPAGQSFYQVLTAAINDFVEHGFDSQERLDHWLRKIEEAGRAALIPERVLRRELQDMLTRIYNRASKTGKLMRLHKGVSQFTLNSIQPRLRGELSRHILSSSSLIKLNREASIQKTLQRFAGWASSVPAGGTEVAEKREVAATVRRSMAGLPFEERRVIVDQGHKLASAINRIVAADGGAIAAVWRHVREGGGYQARPEHERRDDHLFVLRGNWALEKGLIKLAGHQYTDEVEQPGELIYCRCGWVYLYNLRDLPADMLTEKGRTELKRALSLTGR